MNIVDKLKLCMEVCGIDAESTGAELSKLVNERRLSTGRVSELLAEVNTLMYDSFEFFDKISSSGVTYRNILRMLSDLPEEASVINALIDSKGVLLDDSDDTFIYHYISVICSLDCFAGRRLSKAVDNLYENCLNKKARDARLAEANAEAAALAAAEPETRDDDEIEDEDDD